MPESLNNRPFLKRPKKAKFKATIAVHRAQPQLNVSTNISTESVHNLSSIVKPKTKSNSSFNLKENNNKHNNKMEKVGNIGTYVNKILMYTIGILALAIAVPSKSIFTITTAVTGLLVGSIASSIKALDLANKWKTFQQSKAGQVFKIITGNAVGRTIAIITGSVALASAIAATGPIGITLAAASLASVAITALVDTLKVRDVRKLEQENDLHVRNRTAKSSQDFILKLEPKLSQALSEELYIPSSKGKISETQRYLDENSENRIIKKAIAKSIIKNIVGATVSLAGAAIKGDIFGIIKASFGITIGFIGEVKGREALDKVRYQFKKQIDNERQKSDSPGYDNIRELKNKVRKQRIQTLAIKKLVTHPSYRKMNEYEMREQFRKIKEDIKRNEKAVVKNRNIFQIGEKVVKSFVQDFIRAHNPFSKYNAANEIKVKEQAGITKALEKAKLYEAKVSKNLDISKAVSNKPIKSLPLENQRKTGFRERILKENLATKTQNKSK